MEKFSASADSSSARAIRNPSPPGTPRISASPPSLPIEVTLDPETYPNARFARLHDPEGNPIELWQPAGRDS